MVWTRGQIARERAASYARGLALQAADRARRATRQPTPTTTSRPTASVARTFRKQYRPNDRAKRHRLPDEQEKTERVVSYTRRK